MNTASHQTDLKLDDKMSEKREIEVSMTANTHDTENLKSKGDYSGAAEKSDPAEIALVKKLDYRIMVFATDSAPSSTIVLTCQ